MKRILTALAIGVAVSSAGFAERLVMNWGDRLTVIDSEVPGEALAEIALEPGPLGRSISFDPLTRQLWAFEYGVCQVLCPPPQDPITIDPATGSWTFVPLPGIGLGTMVHLDPGIDPVSREIRYFDFAGGNFSYSLATRTLRVDSPLDRAFAPGAVSHRLTAGSGGGIETYVIEFPTTRDPSETTGTKYELARIGGPNGNPPASSGEVTVIGPVDVIAERMAFDVGADGFGYLATMWSLDTDGEENKLYRIDLDSGSVEFLGVIRPPPTRRYISGMAAAPHGFGGEVVAVPTSSRWGLLAFAMLLLASAWPLLRRRRQQRD